MKKKVYALGFFDGVHLGHQALLNSCKEMADQLGCSACALTFDTCPRSLVTGEQTRLINSAADRLTLLKQYGMEQVETVHFDRNTMTMPWQEFFQYLIDALGAAGLVCGDDFRFGSKGEGNAEKLQLFCEEKGLPCKKKKTKSGYSTTAEVLEKLLYTHPIVDKILEYRKIAKLNSTYVEGLIPAIDKRDGKIHSSFNQTVTVTGRISSTEPNLQNIPVRTELGREMRKMFIAKSDDYVLIDADYSQIELRVLAHIANDENMIEAFKSDFDIHSSTAAKIFGVSKDDVTQEMRSAAKAINFGLVYGMGEFSLSQDLHISVKQAKEYINDYLGSYPNVQKYMKETVEFAKENGYVTTMFGRRRDIPEIKASNFNTRAFGERVALNTPIQGSAADIIKLAMINVFRRLNKEKLLSKLILQVHDGLIIEAPKSEVDKVCALLKEEME